jgi:hypothetical protein
MKYAILIDAGFLKRKLGSHSKPLDIAGVHAFLAMLRAQDALADMRLHRVYWYDAPPLESRVAKPLLGGRITLERLLSRVPMPRYSQSCAKCRMYQYVAVTSCSAAGRFVTAGCPTRTPV